MFNGLLEITITIVAKYPEDVIWTIGVALKMIKRNIIVPGIPDSAYNR